jgi:hypothetical protein
VGRRRSAGQLASGGTCGAGTVAYHDYDLLGCARLDVRCDGLYAAAFEGGGWRRVVHHGRAFCTHPASSAGFVCWLRMPFASAATYGGDCGLEEIIYPTNSGDGAKAWFSFRERGSTDSDPVV